MVPMRTEAMRKARIGRGLYQCGHCNGTFKREGIQVDHIDPVIDPKVGFVNWDMYIQRLYCDFTLLQVLCRSCHKIKTDNENRRRL